MSTGDNDEYYRIMNESNADLTAEIKSGKYSGTLSGSDTPSGGGFHLGGSSG